MDENEFTEAESNMNDLISEYQQYQVLFIKLFLFFFANIYKLQWIFSSPQDSTADLDDDEFEGGDDEELEE